MTETQIDNFQDDNRTVLVHRFLEGSLESTDFEKLLAILENEPAELDRLVQLIDLDSSLRELCFSIGSSACDCLNTTESLLSEKVLSVEEISSLDELARKAAIDADRRQNPSVSTLPKSFGPKSPRSFLPLPLLLAFFLLAFGILSFFEWNPDLLDDFTVRESRQPKTPACVINVDEVAWTGEDAPPKLGEPLLPRQLCFDSGSVELLFYNGVRSVVEGPAELLLIDEKRVFCRRGRWSVTVPKQGSGFEIQTPNMTIRDIGTQFYASVDEKSSELHIVKGLVELRESDGQKTTFETNQAVRFQGSGILERMTADVGLFVTKQEMRLRSDRFWKYQSATASPKSLKESALRCVEFGPDVLRDAVIEGGRYVLGGSPDSSAFRIESKTDRLRLRSAGSAEAMTVVLRVKVDRLGDEMNPILMTQGSGKNGIVWHVLSGGRFLVGLRYHKGGRSYGVFETPAILTEERLGRWCQLALSVDGKNRTISIYVDGDPVFTEKLPRSTTLNLNGLEVGSWSSRAREAASLWHIEGEVEQVLLFDRVLNIGEIRTLQQP